MNWQSLHFYGLGLEAITAAVSANCVRDAAIYWYKLRNSLPQEFYFNIWIYDYFF